MRQINKYNGCTGEERLYSEMCVCVLVSVSVSERVVFM